MFKEKISIFQQILDALFPFRAEYGFPVVVQGRKDGRKETCVRAGTLCRSMENRLDGIPFFLSYGAPLARELRYKFSLFTLQLFFTNFH